MTGEAMTLTDLLDLAIDVSYVALLVIAVFEYRRNPTPVRQAVVMVFASVAIFYVGTFVGRLWPAALPVSSTVSLVALIALPYLTVRLAAMFGSLRRWVGQAALAACLGFSLVSVGYGSGLLVLGTEAILAVVAGLIVYFVLVEAIAAALLWRASMGRAGSARIRLTIAALATAVLSAVVLLIGLGGVLAPSDAGAQANLGFVLKLLTLAAAHGYLASLLPPRWLRRLPQQAIGDRFTRRLTALPTGSSEDDVWQALAETASRATGAASVAVHLDGVDAPPRVTVGWPEAVADDVLDVPLHIDEREVGTLRVRTAGAPLFQEDDIELLAILGQQAARAAERERVLRERERLIDELRAASAAKSDFLAAMSHELRTPLNAIIGFSELLSTQDPANPTSPTAVVDYAGHIHSSGLHLLDLINEILDLARVEAGRVDLRPTRFALDGLVEATAATMRPLAEQKSLDLTLQLAPGVEVDADEGRIRQVVFNLLSNAIKFTPDGGSVQVSLRAAGRTAYLACRDTGPGIAEGDQARVFEAFQQLSPSTAAQPGTGLGLALARQLVEAHGGHLRLESRVGEGSTFTVELPLPVAAETTAEAELADGSTRPSILIIEDDRPAAELLRVYLEGAGYRVHIAADGEAGLRAVEALSPVAILLDILLPDIDGWEVLRRLKRDPRTRPIPVIVVSIVDDAPLGLALGAIDYFVKPASRDALLESIGRLTFTTKVRSRTVTVLVIDDDAAVVERCRAHLEPEGFAVIAVPTGQQGLAVARSRDIDLILLGLALPDDDAADLVARLKSEAMTRDIPIWLATPDRPLGGEAERFSGQLLGLVERDAAALDALRSWLDRVGARRVEAMPG